MARSEKQKQQWREWYARNKDDPNYRRRLKEFDKQRRASLAEWFEELKKEKCCYKCGFDHPAALDFHHRNPDDKLYEVALMPQWGISKKKILAEIEKCDVLCANCHRILHYELKHGSIV
jgi:hypothetical protein